MNDEEYFEQLCSNSVDGTLTDSEREKLEAHLAECPSCAALLRDLREMRALFAQEAEAPDSLHDGIMEQLRQETFFISFAPLYIKGLDSCPVRVYAIEGLQAF